MTEKERTLIDDAGKALPYFAFFYVIIKSFFFPISWSEVSVIGITLAYLKFEPQKKEQPKEKQDLPELAIIRAQLTQLRSDMNALKLTAGFRSSLTPKTEAK